MEGQKSNQVVYVNSIHKQYKNKKYLFINTGFNKDFEYCN